MRHIGSLILALVIAPAVWLLTGIGLVQYDEAGSTPVSQWDEFLGFAALGGAGILFALLVMPRLSPIGPTLAGLAYLAMAGWATADGASLDRASPRTFLGTDSALTAPADGIAALLAIPLLATVLSPRRWRRFDRVPALYAGGPGQPGYPAGPSTGPAGPSPLAGSAPPAGQIPLAGPAPPAGPIPPTGAGFHHPPPNHGPIAAPNYGPSAYPKYGPPQPPTYPRQPGPPASGPPASGPPAYGPPGYGPPLSGPPVSGPPVSGPPVSGPPVSGPPVSGPPARPTSVPPVPPVPPSFVPLPPIRPVEKETTVETIQLGPPPAQDETTQLTPPPPGDDTQLTPPPAQDDTTQLTPPPAGDETTRLTAQATPDDEDAVEPTEHRGEETQRLPRAAPPAAAYPPPGHSTPTSAPVDPDATGRQ